MSAYFRLYKSVSIVIWLNSLYDEIMLVRATGEETKLQDLIYVLYLCFENIKSQICKYANEKN